MNELFRFIHVRKPRALLQNAPERGYVREHLDEADPFVKEVLAQSRRVENSDAAEAARDVATEYLRGPQSRELEPVLSRLTRVADQLSNGEGLGKAEFFEQVATILDELVRENERASEEKGSPVIHESAAFTHLRQQLINTLIASSIVRNEEGIKSRSSQALMVLAVARAYQGQEDLPDAPSLAALIRESAFALPDVLTPLLAATDSGVEVEQTRVESEQVETRGSLMSQLTDITEALLEIGRTATQQSSSELDPIPWTV